MRAVIALPDAHLGVTRDYGAGRSCVFSPRKRSTPPPMSASPLHFSRSAVQLWPAVQFVWMKIVASNLALNRWMSLVWSWTGYLWMRYLLQGQGT